MPGKETEHPSQKPGFGKLGLRKLLSGAGGKVELREKGADDH